MTTYKQVQKHLIRENLRFARLRWGTALNSLTTKTLEFYTREFGFSVPRGDLLLLDRGWYVTHSGLIALAKRKKCRGIQVDTVRNLSDKTKARFTFRAMVFPSSTSVGFVGYGDADPTNVSALVHGSELRVAETRAVNRALRKAYGIGLCSVEELNSGVQKAQPLNELTKLPPQPSGGSGPHGRSLRDHLCQIIRQHELDPNLVKAYAADFCGVKTLKDANREQVETFVNELSEWAERDRNALLCQLNSYLGGKEGAA